MTAYGGPPFVLPKTYVRSRFTLVGLLLALLTAGLLVRCSSQQKTEAVPTHTLTPPPFVEPIDKGNGVFYFPAVGEAYIASLAKFYEGNGKHCDLQGFTEKTEITGSYQDKTARTATTGFILHCHDIAIDAQSVTIP